MKSRMRTPEKEAADFWGRIAKTPGGCWNWTAARNPHGYGHFSARLKVWQAHRYMWGVILGRPLPAGLCVLHRCDNPPCCNPAHLFLGTLADNNRDRAAKGRNRNQNGKFNSRSKLTATQVDAIRSLWAAGDETQLQIANHFGINRTTVSRILLRRIWKHVPDPIPQTTNPTAI